MLHTTIDKAKGTLPIDSIETDLLPKADYYALGHLHIDFRFNNFVYPGPVFPNNFQELEDLKHGSFYIIDTNSGNPLRKVELKIKDVVSLDIKVKNPITATEQIIFELGRRDIQDKIVLLRVSGELESGNISDIKFLQIEEFAKKKGAYFILKNTHNLNAKETELDIELKDSGNIEEEAIKFHSEQNPSDFNKLIPQLIDSLSIEKQEDEKTDNFTNRLLEETKKILNF